MQKPGSFFSAKKRTEKKEEKELRTILLNAIKMQALYSDGKVKFIETSSAIN